MDNAWALREIDEFLKLAELHTPAPARNGPAIIGATRRKLNRGSQTDITASAQVVEQIFDRALPGWRTSVPDNDNATVNRWSQHIEAAQRTKVALVRAAELQEKLGDNAPTIDADQLHHWIWDGAQSLWRSRHYRESVGAVANKVNAETQNKTGRRDLSETNLFLNVFSDNPPKPGEPRLRIIPDDNSQTYKSLHRGVRNFAEGCYAALRNPIAHQLGELPENEALEQLAAFSIVARWVDTATLVRA